ncbi:MAG: hypothetical protein COA52_01245 [Hyphomicrobiales bacterium]|nr:MAG: hypothetical protein COA52_00155 [Hyphomicrobiales bacterium]PCJ96858.1 MAG: hypothetical protein COA52_01245 [Hyphomicrobiales bacterium]
MYNIIKETYLQARKDKNKEEIALYSYLIGEIENKLMTMDGVKKTYPNIKIVALVKSIKAKSEEMNNTLEVELLTKLIPTQMNEAGIMRIFQDNPELNNMGMRMKYLKENYGGLYDGKLASTIAKSINN